MHFFVFCFVVFYILRSTFTASAYVILGQLPSSSSDEETFFQRKSLTISPASTHRLYTLQIHENIIVISATQKPILLRPNFSPNPCLVAQRIRHSLFLFLSNIYPSFAFSAHAASQFLHMYHTICLLLSKRNFLQSAEMIAP